MHHARAPQGCDVEPGTQAVCFCHGDADGSHHANRRIRLVRIVRRRGVAHDGHNRIEDACGDGGARSGIADAAHGVYKLARVLQHVIIARVGHVGAQRRHLRSWSARANGQASNSHGTGALTAAAGTPAAQAASLCAGVYVGRQRSTEYARR